MYVLHSRIPGVLIYVAFWLAMLNIVTIVVLIVAHAGSSLNILQATSMILLFVVASIVIRYGSMNMLLSSTYLAVSDPSDEFNDAGGCKTSQTVSVTVKVEEGRRCYLVTMANNYRPYLIWHLSPFYGALAIKRKQEMIESSFVTKTRSYVVSHRMIKRTTYEDVGISLGELINIRQAIRAASKQRSSPLA